MKPLPTKAEKSKESRYASSPHLPEVAEISTEDDLLNCVTSFAWSPFIFKGPRLKENFISTDFLVLDIDQGLTVEESEKRIEESGFACLCVTTTSHRKDHHRYRLILPLSRTITKVEDFEASIADLMEAFPESDPACKDYARFFFGSTVENGYWIDGDLLEPISAPESIKETYNRSNTSKAILVDASIEELIVELYGEPREVIPEAVSHFLVNAHTGLSGSWNNSISRCCYVLGLQNIDFETVEQLMEYVSPEKLDKSDRSTIIRSWNDGQRDRE